MIEGKYYQCMYMVVPFIAAFIDRPAVFVPNAPVTVVHTKYSELVIKLVKDRDDEERR